MKKTLTLCLFLNICFQFLPGQDYSPMAIEDAHWLMYNPGPFWSGAPHEYYIKGDTLIDGKVYKKVYYRVYYQDPSTHQTPYPYIIEAEYLHAAIRDDTLQRKVFLYRFNDYGIGDIILGTCPLLEEFLLYDFDLEVGDTLSGLCLFYSGDELSIDSVYFKEHHGYYLRAFHSDYYAGENGVEFLERIGFQYSGIFNYDLEWISYRSVLHEYCIGDDCDYLLGSKEHIEPNGRPRVCPNPASSHVRIDFADPAGSNHRLCITDTMGKVFLDEEIQHGASAYTVSVADWPPGVYFVQYLADGVFLGAGRVVVY